MDACISTSVKSMYKKVKHRYIQKSVRQACSKEGVDSGGDYWWDSVREEIPKSGVSLLQKRRVSDICCGK